MESVDSLIDFQPRSYIFSRNCAKVDLVLSNGLIKIKIMFNELNLEDSDGLGKQTV